METFKRRAALEVLSGAREKNSRSVFHASDNTEERKDPKIFPF